MRRTSALKWIVSTVLCLALVFALLPTAVFAETGTAEVGTWDEFTTALADSSVNTITLTDNIASPQESGDLALVIGSSDRAVTITGGQITVKNAGIILGGDVTFQNIELYFANSVRNAILANGHSLTLDTVTNTSEFDISLFCGGVTDYCGSNISEIPATGTDGHITIKGTNSLGNIYAGSLSDVMDDAADSPNEYTGNATVTIVSGASGMGGIYAHGAREDRSGGNYNVMLNASAKYTVSGGVTINLSNATTTVDGATGGSSNAVVNYVAANGNEAVHTLKNIGALTLSGTTPNLAPATNSTIDTNASVTVPNGARLDLTNFTNTTALDSLTIGSLAGGGTLVLGSDQMLTITDTVTGETGVAIGGVGYDGNSTTSFSEDTVYITTGAEISGSFTALSEGYALENDNGNWTAVVTEVFETRPVSFTISQEDCELTISEMEGGITVEAICEKQNDADLLTDIPLTISISKEGAAAVAAAREYDPMVGYLYSPVHGIAISTEEPEEGETGLAISFYTDEETVPVAAGEYTITITAPLASGEMASTEFTLTVTEDPVVTYAVVIAETANGTVTADKAEAAAGETVALTVTPAANYALESLTVTDSSSDAVTVTDNAFTMPASAVTVTAVFAPCSHSGGKATCTEQATCGVCGASYGELDASNHVSTTYTNGFRDCCGAYESATDSDSDGVYEIANAGQLYWFAAQVNDGQTSINGELTADIVVNEGVLTKSGELNGDGSSFRVWTPIGTSNDRYTGTFDGGSFTVSGLYFNDSDANEVGLFGYIGDAGAVHDLGVVNSYISGGNHVGGVVGYAIATVSVANCYNSATVIGKDYVGGVVGTNSSGTVTNCYNSGTIRGTGTLGSVGGVVGQSFGTATNCHNTGDVTGSKFSVGGVVGTNSSGTVTNCYNSGAVSGSGNGVGGVAGSNTGSVTNCYNTGDVTGNNYYVGGVVGANSGSTVTNCYNTGSVTGSKYYVGGVVGNNYNSGTVTNCYYFTGCAKDGNDAVQFGIGSGTQGNTTADAEGVTTGRSDFSTGEVCYLLNGDQTTTTFKQTCGTGIPTFTGNTVYYGYVSCAADAEMVYTNNNGAAAEKPAHGNITYANKGSNHTWTCGICGDSGEEDHAHIDNKACICGKKITPVVTVSAASNLTYTGAAQNLVTAGSTTGGTLWYKVNDGEWSTTAPSATNADSYAVYYKVVGNENYEDVAAQSVTVTVTPMNVSGAAVTLGTALTYNSTVQTQSVASVTLNGLTLTAGDYTVTGNQQTGAGDYNLTISGKGNFTGEITKTFTISSRTVTLPVFDGLNAQYLHTGSAIEPAFTLKDDLGNVIDAGEYTVAYSNNTDIGTATITITDKDGGNYTVSGTATFEISTHSHVWAYTADGAVITATCKGTIGTCSVGTATVTLVSPANLVYDGNAKTVTISGSIDGVTLPEIQYTGNRTDAGKHTATLTLGTATATLEFTITKADAAATAPEAKTGLIYNGSAQALVTAGSTQYGTMQYSLDNASWSAEIPTGTNAGEYTVYYKVVGDSNHNDTDPASVTVSIGQMDLGGTAVTLGTALTYNGTAQTQSVASVTLNGLTLTAGDYTVTGNQQTGAGDYNLTITGKGNCTGTVTADWSIAKASMTITADNVTVIVGKAAPDVSALTYTVTGLVNGETADDALTKKPALSYAETPDTTQEGSYTINISGAEAANYTITYVTGTLTVSEKTAVTITVNIPANLVYDGTDQSDRIKANITAVDTATGEAVTVAGYEYQFSANPINAGSYTLTVSVVDSDEQYVGSVNVSFTIAKRSLTLKADDKSAYVNDSEPEYTFTVTGLLTGHSASGAVADCADADMTKAGTYDITISAAGLVIKNGETDVTANYAVTTEKGTLTVREYSLPVIPTPTPEPEPEETVTVPVTDEESTVEVKVTVTEGKATVEDVDLEDLEKVVDGNSNTVTIDFSELDEKITEVELPREVVEKIAETAGESEQTLEIVLSDGVSIEFNASVLSEQVQQTGGTSLTVSIIPHEDAKLTHEQKTAVGDRPAYDISVTSDGKNISNMGGKITVTVPYELKTGEKAGGLVVYYVDDHGKRERCETRYDARNKRLSWQTDHLSLYMLDYDEKRVEACDGGEYCPINAFTDTDSKAWYHNGVHCCIENDLMNGISDDLFAPNGTTTRAQIVTILWRLEGKPVVNYLMQFEDVASESWYTGAVRWAASENIVGGYGNGKFGPNDPITRQQMAAILYRYCQYKGIDVSVGEDTNILSYTDAFSISEWAIPAMQWACGSGMIRGIADGDGMKLDPSGSATRAQIATILWRFCDTIMDN